MPENLDILKDFKDEDQPGVLALIKTIMEAQAKTVSMPPDVMKMMLKMMQKNARS